LQRGVAVRREGGIVDSTLSPTRQRVTPLEHFFDLVFVSAFA
jgi:low temperature requirement protein LtrA